MVGFVFIGEGMSYTLRPVLWSGIDFGGGESVMVWGSVSQHHQTELVVIAGNLNAVRYREDYLLPHVVPFLQAHPDMTMPPAILLVLCVTGMSVFCHGPDLNPIEHVGDLGG